MRKNSAKNKAAENQLLYKRNKIKKNVEDLANLLSGLRIYDYKHITYISYNAYVLRRNMMV